MTAALAAESPVAPELASVRRWARLNLWGLIAFMVFAVGVAIGLPDPDPVMDLVLLIGTPIYTALGVLLALSIYRAFRRLRPALALATLAVGIASCAAGVAAAALFLIGGARADDVAIAVGTVLTGVELFLLGLLFRMTRATPRSLWILGLLAGLGLVAAPVPAAAPDALLLVAGVLVFAFPFLLYRLTQLDLPPRPEPAAA